MGDLEIVKRMALRVRDETTAYLASGEDFAEVVRRRPRDVTRRIDLAAERALDDAISAEGIAARVISEELGERIVSGGRSPECTLLFDPVDGSNNVASGIPYYCTALALAQVAEHATFADLAAAAVSSACCGTFAAARGQGAFLDGKKINAGRSGRKPAYGIYAYGAGAMPPGLVALQEGECIVRTMGSIALDICQVAKGTLDAVIDSRGKVSGYDVMAAGLILREAGGELCQADGASMDTMPIERSGLSIVAAANTGLRDRLVTLLSIRRPV